MLTFSPAGRSQTYQNSYAADNSMAATRSYKLLDTVVSNEDKDKRATKKAAHLHDRTQGMTMVTTNGLKKV